MFIYKQEIINYLLKIASFSIQVTQVPIYFQIYNFEKFAFYSSWNIVLTFQIKVKTKPNIKH